MEDQDKVIDVNNPREEDLTRFQRIQLSRFNLVYIGNYQREGWSGELPFYAFKCRIHGLVVDYEHGYNKTLHCPECRKNGK